MEDQTQQGYESLDKEFKDLQAKFSKFKVKDFYSENESDKASEDARTFNEMSIKIARIKKSTELREYYQKKFKGCRVDVFIEAPFENCSLIGYEKHTLELEYDAFKPLKQKIIVSDGSYSGTISTVSNSINVSQDAHYETIYQLQHITKTIKVSFYVRVMKEDADSTIKFDDKSLTFIDVALFKKPKQATTGFKLFKIFSYISSCTLLAAFVITILQTIGSNYIIGRLISKGKLENLGTGFVNFFNSPALQIILISLTALYLASQIIVFVTAKHYNSSVPTREFEMLKNVPTQIANTAFMLITLTFFMFTNAVSFAYCAAPNLPYSTASGIFSNLDFIEKFAEIAHLETTRAFTFASHGDAAIYLAGVAISFSELVGMVYVLVRILMSVIEIVGIYTNISSVEQDMYERSKLTDKKLAEYETKLKEFNKNLVIIDDANLHPSITKRVPAVFDSESNLIPSKKIQHIQKGRFNPFRLFIPACVLPLIGVVFLVFDAIHDLCATNLFPGSDFVKIAAYLVLLATSSGAFTIAIKINEKCSKLDD